MNNYIDIIHKRYSCRSFTDEVLTEAEAATIQKRVDSLLPLFPNIKYKIKLLSKSSTIAVGAPYFLALYSEEKPLYLENAGYIMEQMDLYLQENGYGACYIGLGRVSLFNNTLGGLKLVIMLGFGKADLRFRTSDAQFDRKAASEIIRGEATDFAQEVRLAPSAMNSQPIRVLSKTGEAHIYRNQTDLVGRLFLKRLNCIDVGIATFFIHAALNARGRSFMLCIIDNPPFFEGAEYSYTIKYM